MFTFFKNKHEELPLPPKSPYVPRNLNEARAHILPIVRSAADRGLTIMGGKNLSPPAFLGICRGLDMCFGYDNGDTIVRINMQNLSAWGISADDVYSIAAENLMMRSSAPMKEIKDGLFASSWGDQYGSSRMLLPELMMKHITEGSPVVMAPVRNGLFLCSDRNESALALMTQLSEKALNEPQPLSPLMLRLVEGAWTNYIPAAEAVKLKNMKTRLLAAEYATQKRYLDQNFKDRGLSIFVAAYLIYGDIASAEPLQSGCSWSKGVRAVLPLSDLICFVDPNKPEDAFVVAFDNVMGIVGNLLTSTNAEPPRFMVEAFPDKTQLAKLRHLATANA